MGEQRRHVTRITGYRIFQQGTVGGWEDVRVRRMYDDYDTLPFRDTHFDSVEDAARALEQDPDVGTGTYLVLPAVTLRVKINYEL